MKRRSTLRRWARRVARLGLIAAVVYGVAGFLTARIGPEPPIVMTPEAGPPPVGGTGLDVRRADPDREPLASWLDDGAVELRGALSVHSGRSHDAEGTFDEIGAAAAQAGLDFVVLGDHPSTWLEEPGALDPLRVGEVLLVPGQEMVIPGSGRVLVVGLEADTIVERWEGEVADLTRRVSAADGYVSVVHARSPRGRERWQAGLDAPGVHAWETLDVSEIARIRLADRWAGYHLTSFLAGLVTGRAQGPVLALNREGTSAPGLLAYDSARARERLTLTAGLNHHPKARIAGRLVPPYTPFFRSFVNHVRVEAPLGDDPARARARLLRGLREGEVFVSMGEADEAGGFRFGVLGDSSSGGRLIVRLPPAAPGRFFVRLLRNGRDVAWIPVDGGAALTIRPPGPGTYRVEVARAGIPLGSVRYGLRPWILSNAVDVGPRPQP